MTLAPIALFAYNRPGHLMRTVEALRSARYADESGLWIFCDGPKRPKDSEAVAQVRAYARSVEGFETVTVVERDRNFGLAASVTDGVGRLCGEFGRVIVVEDDLMVSPGFLEFLNRALDRYEKDDKVMQVSGYMYPGHFGASGGTLFLPTTSCWGWATWKRAWDCYDPAAAGSERLCQDGVLRRRFDLDGSYDYSGMLRRQAEGSIDSWGIRWYWTVFKRNGLVLYPARTLVRNIGVDGSGTHGGGIAQLQAELSLEGDSHPFRFPDRLEVNESVLRQVAEGVRSVRRGILARLWKKFVA